MSPAAHLLALANPDLANHSRHRSLEGDFHLHRLDQSQGLADLDPVSHLHVDRDDHRRGSRRDPAEGLPTKSIGVTVDLHPEADLRAIVENAPGPVVDDEPRRLGAFLAHRGPHDAAVEVHTIAPGANRVDLEAIALASVREIDLLSLAWRNAIAGNTGGIDVEIRTRDAARLLVGQDGGSNQCIAGRVGIDTALGLALFVPAVEPGRIDSTPLVGLARQ